MPYSRARVAHHSATVSAVPLAPLTSIDAATGEGSIRKNPTDSPAIEARRVITPFTFLPTADISTDGRQIVVTAHAPCSEGEGDQLELRVAVTQLETGALAEEWSASLCATEFVSVQAATDEDAPFEEGDARACGLVIVDHRNDVVEGPHRHTFQWCRDITLARAEPGSVPLRSK